MRGFFAFGILLLVLTPTVLARTSTGAYTFDPTAQNPSCSDSGNVNAVCFKGLAPGARVTLSIADASGLPIAAHVVFRVGNAPLALGPAFCNAVSVTVPAGADGVMVALENPASALELGRTLVTCGGLPPSVPTTGTVTLQQ